MQRLNKKLNKIKINIILMIINFNNRKKINQRIIKTQAKEIKIFKNQKLSTHHQM